MKVPIEVDGFMPFKHFLNKVPELTLTFWIIKIMSTTAGEIMTDFLSVTVGWGQGVTCCVMIVLLVAALFMQLRTRHYTPLIYWLTVVIFSIVGIQITDFLTDKLGISLYVSTVIFAVILAMVFVIWYRVERTLSIQEIFTRRREWFYWAAILSALTLGTAAGDLATEALGLGFKWGFIIFGSMITITFIAWRLTGKAVLTFWVAYILTRPFGAAFGDLLAQSEVYGGLGLGVVWSCVLLLLAILVIGAIPASILEPSDSSLSVQET